MMRVPGISHDDLDQWKANAVTRHVLQAIADAADLKRRDIGRGVGLDPENADKTQANAFRANGYSEALEDVLNLTVGE